MTAQFTPTEAQIERVLTSYTPRQVAMAYLRATRRARDAETAFGLMSDVADLTRSSMSGDLSGAEAAVRSAERRARTLKQTTEGGAA